MPSDERPTRIASSSGVDLAAAGTTFDIAGSTGGQTIQDLGGVAGSIVALGANSLTAGTSNSTVFAGVIGGTGGFVKQGSGTLVFTGNNTYAGVTTVSAGILQLGNGGTTGMVAGNVVIASGALLAFNRSDDVVFAGSIGGDGAVSYMGPGTVTLTGSSTYTGGTAISGGVVQAGSDSAFGTAGTTLTLAGGTVQATASFTSTSCATLTATCSVPRRGSSSRRRGRRDPAPRAPSRRSRCGGGRHSRPAPHRPRG